MAITTTNSVQQPRPFSLGPVKVQLLTYRALVGATSGTVTADGLARIDHIMLDGKLQHSAAPTFATNVATLAFTVSAETKAAQTKGGVTITAVADQGVLGNSVTLTYTAGATAGAEVVTVSGFAITVQIETTVSTITQVRTAINASAAAAALVLATGTSATTVAAATVTSSSGGVAGGSRGTIMCIGI